MSLLSQNPRLADALEGLAILAGSYLAARLASWLFGKVLARAAARTAGALDDQLVAALKRPLTYALFLAGAWVAVQRLSAPPRFAERLDILLFVFGVLLLTHAFLRSYGILLHWYATRSRGAEEGPAREFGPLFNKLGKIFIAVTAAIVILQRLGVNVASFVVSLGVGSLAIGLAAQDTLANMFAGFILMLDRPFRIGDRIVLATGEVGDVVTIGIRATRIKTLDETILIVPNSLLVKDRLVNQTRPTRAITTRIDVGVAYGSDLALAKRVLAEAALACGHVDRERAPLVLVTRFGDFAVSLRVIFWAKDYADQGLALSQVHEEIHRRLAEAGIEMPVPIRRMIHEDAGVRREG